MGTEAEDQVVKTLHEYLDDLGRVASGGLDIGEVRALQERWEACPIVGSYAMTSVIGLKARYDELFASAEQWSSPGPNQAHSEALELIESQNLGYAEGRIVHIMLTLGRASGSVAKALLEEVTELMSHLLKRKRIL